MLAGLKTACLYSYMPHKLGFCGPDEDCSLLIKKFIEGNEKLVPKIKKLLSEFVGSYNYYCLIARKNKIADIFDPKVVEAYWLGNDLLKPVTVADLKKMVLEEFVGKDLLTKERAREIVASIKKKIEPLHHFHVLKIGSVTGKVDLKGKMIDLCLVNIGKIKKVAADKVLVEYLTYQGQKKLLEIKNILGVKVKPDDLVSFHWGMLCAKVASEFNR